MTIKDVNAFQCVSKTNQELVQINPFWIKQMGFYYPELKAKMDQDRKDTSLYHETLVHLLEADRDLSECSFFWKMLHDIDEDYSQSCCSLEDAEYLYDYYIYVFLDQWVALLPRYQDLKRMLKQSYYRSCNGKGDGELMADHEYYLPDEVMILIDNVKQ